MKCDLEMFEVSELGCQFDVILLEPPLQEYQRAGAVFDKYWDWDEVRLLDITTSTKQLGLCLAQEKSSYFNEAVSLYVSPYLVMFPR